MRILAAILAGLCVGLVAYVIGYIRGLGRGALYGVELIARDNLDRLQALGISPATWIEAGQSRRSKDTAVLQ